ncbi:MAG TPA: response regulator [Nitrospiraceae bacterium]|nr:response regulator [Nitrospiraceae bacterium]
MILLLTPTDDLQEQITTFLKDRGYEVCVTCSPADVKSHIEASHTDLVILDMHVDQPRGNLMLHNLREGGYTGRLIMLFGPSQVHSRDTSSPRSVNAVLKAPLDKLWPYDLGPLETALSTSLGAL